MNGKVVNLKQKRKQVARDEARQKADQNAVTFGTPKALKDLQKAKSAKAARDLAGHKRDG